MEQIGQHRGRRIGSDQALSLEGLDRGEAKLLRLRIQEPSRWTADAMCQGTSRAQRFACLISSIRRRADSVLLLGIAPTTAGEHNLSEISLWMRT